MKVSVLMITYNHEPYVAQAIESVLMQEVDCEIELVIGEDCSTDGTREVIARYLKSHPGRIRARFSESNQGVQRNFLDTLAACDGDFIATLEGDDYWTSPKKLDKQLTFLADHPRCVMCGHRVRVVSANGSPQDAVIPFGPKPSETKLADILQGNSSATLSVVFRRSALGKLPAWFSEAMPGDWVLWVHLATRGDIGFLDETLGAYRRHESGVWSGGSEKWRIEMSLTNRRRVQCLLDSRHRWINRQRMAAGHLQLASLAEDKGDLCLALSHVLRACGNDWRGNGWTTLSTLLGKLVGYPRFLTYVGRAANPLRRARRRVSCMPIGGGRCVGDLYRSLFSRTGGNRR